MRNHQDSGSRSIVAILSFGALVFILVTVSLYTLWQQQTKEDTYFSSRENLAFQEIVAVKNIRRQAAEEFINAVVNCIHPANLRGNSLTEQQVNDRVTMVTDNFNTCDDKHTRWTFEPPCTLKLNKLSHELRAEVKLGDLVMCNDTIAANIFSALDHCTVTSNPVQCLVNAVIESPDVKKEIEKSVEIQAISR